MAEAEKERDPVMEMARAFDRCFGRGDGPTVLDVLEAKFRAQPMYVSGGEEAARETSRRAAQKEVVDFILNQIARSQRGDRNE